jgi:PGF-CTERM protein
VSVSITDYEGAIVEYLDVVADDEEFINQSQVDELEETLDARGAADLEQTVSWDITTESSESETSIQATVEYDTTNWEAYTTELEERGNPLETELEFSGQATSEGDSIDLTMDFQVNREDIVNSAISDAAEAAAESETEDESAVEAFRSLEDAQLQVAKADMVFGEDTVEVRAAAQFENLSTFQGTLDEFPSDVPITHYYVEGDGESSTTYVYVEDLDMSEEEVRETTLADEDTVIHAPGEWEEEFPTMDIAGTADYLGVDVDVNKPGTDAGEDTPTSDDGPGFGLAVALVALLVASLVALRRRD